MSDQDHFKGKSALEHLKDARIKAKRETDLIHGIETPGHLVAGADGAKNLSMIALLFWMMMNGCHFTFSQKMLFLMITCIGWMIWSVCRSAIYGWSRLEKLNRVIREERKEIETNREQEKEELTEMYRAKGFSGKLLEDVIDVLMADDNRLLNVMLEEELGLSLESYEHPLKQAFGAFIGVLSTSIVLLGFTYFFSHMGMIIASSVITLFAAFLIAKIEKNPTVPIMIWNLASLFLAALVTFFITRAIF